MVAPVERRRRIAHDRTGAHLVRLTGASLFRLDFVLTPAILAVTALLSLGTALAAGVGPGLLAARLRPIEALRYE